jgi:hypothetical protein
MKVQLKNFPLKEGFMVERKHVLATDKLTQWSQELYGVCLELVTLTKMWEEISTGPRNANDAFVLESIDKRIKQMRRERSALHKMIHEEPEIKSS